MSLPAAFVDEIREIFPADALALDEGTRAAYGYDNSRREALPDAVVFPASHDQVAALVVACRRHRMPLTARGRGTNTTGATVPIAGGIVASFERMNRIVRIEPGDRLAVVEPGVLNADLQTALAAHGLFWPPDPTSAPYCTIGGNLACNAGGPHTVKYGASRDNILGLRAVAGNGTSFRSGTHTTKGATGYDLTRIIVGSEGTLALITEATLKLTPKPTAVRTLRAAYDGIQAAADAVARIMAQPVTPRALEFMDEAALQLVRERGAKAPAGANALLLIEVDGEPDALDAAQAAIEHAASGEGLVELRSAGDDAEAATLWAARKALSPALRSISEDKINEDVVVPVSRIPELVARLREIAAEFRIPIVNFGHAGNGNLHVNLLPRDPRERARAEKALPLVFGKVIELDGTLSGEHGIGIAKRDFMPQAVGAGALSMMRGLKNLFDPEHILNPGKLLPAEAGQGTGDPGPDHPDLRGRASAPEPQGPGTVVLGSSSP
ncbi:MAG TPA: FAD-linked oxidase C-terminal domain-containing protein [Rhodanobacteraceae bacterium]|nr:FAD-linked oxidase C-terminal domain-containing protein [Rhodanobacteraceae bacterium]